MIPSEVIRAAHRLISQVERELQPMERVKHPYWHFYVHPDTLKHMQTMMAEAPNSDPVMYRVDATSVPMARVMNYDPRKLMPYRMTVLGINVMPDEAIDAHGIELRYAVRGPLSAPLNPARDVDPDIVALDNEDTREQRAHP